MALFSIKDVETLSGIKAHTLRIWEQRYQIINPKRTDTNIRYFTEEDLKKIINIALLNKKGVKISKIAKMSVLELERSLSEFHEDQFGVGPNNDVLTMAMLEMDEYKFDKVLNLNTEQIGFENTMMEVVYPFLEKVSLLWITGGITPVQEQFVSNLIRRKILSAIDTTPWPNGQTKKKFLLYLPPGEKQELTLLFFHYLLRKRWHQVWYLGKNISYQDLKDAYQICNPDFVFTIVSESFINEPIQRYVERIASICKSAKILLTGYHVVSQPLMQVPNVLVLQSLDATMQFLDRQV